MKLKRLFFALCFLCLFVANRAFSQQQLITATCTITNTPTNGYTITVNGSVFLWTNTPSGNFQIQNSNSIPADTTNLFNALSLAQISGVLQVYYVTPTNEIAFYGLNLTASVSTNWATLVLTTNTATNGWYITGPASGIASPSSATNMYSQAISDLDAYSTNSFGPFDIALSNYVSLQATQTITGPKIFTGANIYSNANQLFSGGTVTNAVLSNCVPALTNGYAVNILLTNGQNFGNPFRSPGTGVGSEQFGLGASATFSFANAFGDGAIAGGTNASAFGSGTTASGLDSTAIGSSTSATGPNSSAIGTVALATGSGASAFGVAANASALQSTALGYFATAGSANSTAIGQNASTTATNQIMLGIPGGSVEIPGSLEVDGVMSNTVFAGTANFAAQATHSNKVAFVQGTVSTFANGNNTLDPGTNTYILISGPTGNATNASIKGGFNGRILMLEYDTNLTFVVANESGFDSTATNRIRTGLSADEVFTNNPTFINLIYNATLSRWVITGHN